MSPICVLESENIGTVLKVFDDGIAQAYFLLESSDVGRARIDFWAAPRNSYGVPFHGSYEEMLFFTRAAEERLHSDIVHHELGDDLKEHVTLACEALRKFIVSLKNWTA